MSRLRALIDLRRGDGPIVLPAAGVAFLGVGAMSLAGIAADTLFVSAFDLGQISRFYVVTSGVRFAAALGYAALLRRYEGPRLDGALLLVTATSIGVAALLSQRATGALLYAICVSLLVLPPLLPLITFRAVLGTLEARQARRLLPLVAAAATVGVIVASAAVPTLAGLLGTAGVLYAGGVLAVLAAPLPSVLAERAPARQEPIEPPGKLLQALADARRDLIEAPVVGVVLAGVLLGAMAANLVDYALKAALKARYGREEMAAFLGTFGAAANLFILLAQLFGSSRFTARFGVRVSLQALFATLVALGAAVGLAPGVASAAVARLSENTFRYAISAPVEDLLLTPAPPAARVRAKILAKGLANPLGGALAGLLLAAFGAAGPSSLQLGALLALTGAVGMVAVARARRAYTRALARALGEGQLEEELSPQAARALGRELSQTLHRRVGRRDVEGSARLLAVLDDRFFSLDEVAHALRAPQAEIRRAAVAAALRVGRPGEGPRLLALADPDPEDDIEQSLLSGARSLGGGVDVARLGQAFARGRAGNTPKAAALWGEALVGLAAVEASPKGRGVRLSVPPPSHGSAPLSARGGAGGTWVEPPRGMEAVVAYLQQEALVPGSPRRAPALWAIGELRARQAHREVLLSLGSSDRAVFAAAARAAVLIEARGAVAALLGRLTTGSEVRAVTEALALAGPAAVGDLIAALPTTRGQGAAMATSVASGPALTGSVRAARVLARLGPEACAEVLVRYAELGYRARNAVARALATVARRTGEAVDPELVLQAMEMTLEYAESLLLLYPTTLYGRLKPQRESAPDGLRVETRGLLRREMRFRIEETSARLLDLAAVMGDRDLITRARAALAEGVRERGHGLELLENILPRSIAARAVALLEIDWGTPLPTSGKPPPLDGWLEKCRNFDTGALPSSHPMATVLEKVVVLVDSSLFKGLSGEELYPVAEIAEALEYEPGEEVVREGDPGDALFVVVEGDFKVMRAGVAVRELHRGSVFGEVALLDGAPRAATVTAETEGKVLRIPRAEFEGLLDESPELARGVIRTLLGHLRAAGAAG
ncbi:cyclic nucleotide-binding domain-containing protein [Chondromyces apiculatus]|uniref:Cyclic nucleotide-binding domain-containing protein n=1 Tax=Chondromyces apiculatus DSM 436 TaxID=1192034 RepID=A0A017TEB0_9BACT|nr:cyclic nucleotide-binding domain-containing protein [Chondromyces apiculatus]EYF07549.1 Hypothetical protein CAP_8672 [Chondromyces apiculatus DSM 436]